MRVAQLRCRPKTHHWSLYWADRNGRWHRYDDLAPGPVDQVLNEIEADLTCISGVSGRCGPPGMARTSYVL